MQTYPYLNDLSFLKEFDLLKVKEQFVRINVLSFKDEKPVDQIEGDVVSGNITIDGNSAMRRTANLSIVVKKDEYSDRDIRKILTINKKVQLLIGFTNTTDKYEQYPILWFPQGIYVIIAPNITYNNNGINISLTLHDKMALLNGECGGTLPASITFTEIEDVDENGERQISNPTIYQIVQELVNHFGGQQLGKIIIELDKKIKKVMRWTGSTPLYLYQEALPDGTMYSSFSTNENQLRRQGKGTIQEFQYGQDIGYVLTDFIYPQQLTNNPGETIVSVLDKIKNWLGNYEYFYDINGNFRFQEIKNYLNKTYATFLINEINSNNYLTNYTNGKSVYTFEDSDIIQSYSNSPQYQQIKNDFVVWGKRTTTEGKQIPIRYHLAIDKKPAVGNQYKVFFYTDPDDNILKAKRPLEFATRSQFPETGDVCQYYYAANTGFIYKWDASVQSYATTPYIIETIKANDYRTQLYMSGVASQPFGLDSNYYYTELKNEWPKLYDMRQGKFFDEILDQPSNMDFFLDFIDTSTAISEFSIENIGRRTLTISNDAINCIFQPDNPDIVIIEANSEGAGDLREQCQHRRQEYSQVTSDVYSKLVTGGVLRSAYEEIRTELYQYTDYNEQVTLTTLPIYYLEPNVRITIKNQQSGINGDYMIKTISLPLDVNGMMNLSCTKALERI